MRQEFDSLGDNKGFGGNPRIGDEPMSTKTTEWSGTKDGSYLTLEWFNTITRYKNKSSLGSTFQKWFLVERPASLA